MNLLKIKGSKKKEKHYTNEGILESLEGIAGETFNQVKQNVDAGAHEAWDEMLSAKVKSGNEHHSKPSHGHGGDLSAGHELDLSSLGEKTHELKERAHEVTDAGHEYMREIIHAGERADVRNSQEIQVRMHEILIEIKQLSESSGELKQKVEVIAMEQTGENVGIYHVNFLDKMLSFIHELRMSVDDSLAWFGAINSKKQARSYHSMAKKHGTSFTLNNERQVATQVG
jgi:hypothetical protein